MKNKNTFRKWMALFLSISMVAASGITSNVRLRAAEDTPVQETTAEGTTSADTDASASENADETTVANVDQNDTTRTEEIGLNGTEQAAEESAAPSEEENKNAETAAEAEQGTTPATVADSENKETAADSTASSSVSSSSEEEDKNLTASEQIDEARKDATKREYSYEDDLVSVTATLDDPKAVPDNAEFRVTPVTKDSTDYNYDAYMNALNDDAAASSDSDTEKQYTDENTLLYDMAFIYPVEEKDEDGNVTQKEVEVQPAEGAVKISVNFKKDQLTKSLDADKDSDVEIKHLPLTDAVKESNDTTADATNINADDVKVENVKNADVSVEDRTLSFQANGFSVYAVSSIEQTHTDIAEGTSRDYKSILGNAVEYGIVADTYTQKNHTQTNFAVNKYNRENDQVVEADIAGPQDVPFYIGDFSKAGLRFGGSTNSNSVIYDVYTQDTTSNITINNTQKITVNRLTDEYDNNYVNHLIATVADMSNTLAGESESNVNTLKEENVDQNKYIIDTRSAGDNATIYFKVDNNDTGFLNAMNCSGGIHIRKKSGQTIIFNILKDSDVTLKQFQYAVGDDNYTVTSTDQSDSDNNKKLDQQVCQKIIWNFVNATTVNLDTTAGTILAPKANVNSNNTSQGWVVAGGTVITNSEWHFAYQARQYHSKGNAFFTAKKVLLVNNQKQSLSDGEFTFALYKGEKPSADAKPVEEATNSSDGSISFGKLEYNENDVNGGPITYTVKEIAGKDKAIKYDTTTYTIKVYLADDNNGKINTKVKLVNKDGTETPLTSAEQMTFTNTKNSEATGSVTFSGTKTLEGQALTGDEFNFSVKEGDNVVSTGSNAANGTITFTPIRYTQKDAGSHTYKISEDIPADASKETDAQGNSYYVKNGIRYSSQTYTVTVDVKDNGKGGLEVQASKNANALNFKNSYAANGSVTFSGTKTLEGKTLTDNEFNFSVKEGKTEVSTGSNAADGTITFTPISYKRSDVGKHTYTVSEKIPDKAVEKKDAQGNTYYEKDGICYSSQTYTVTVTVTDIGNGTLNVEASDNAKKLNFTNSYEASGSVTFSGTKTLEGKTLTDNEFNFSVKEGKTEVSTGS
ncbi:Spy0128 family protein, partial [Bilifractor sp. LCP21S3_A7]|uniref:Spy0128 family protein n=1 Tax=Bilifractor sp. LCP21S3_A7 TaxID=3438738 RepID=UPI003F9252D0